MVKKLPLKLKSYLSRYPLLNGDTFSYKAFKIKLYYLHHFLAYDIYFINLEQRTEERVVNFWFMLLQVIFAKWVKLCRLLFIYRKTLIYKARGNIYFS